MCLQEFPSMTSLSLFPHKEVRITAFTKQNPWDLLKEKMGSFQTSFSCPHAKWVGFLSYEMGSFSFLDVPLPLFESPYPLTHFFKHSLYLVLSEQIITIFLYPEFSSEILSPQDFSPDFFSPNFWNENIETPHTIEEEQNHYFEEYFAEKKHKYLEKIQHIQSLIQKGEFFQINLSHSIQYRTSLQAFSIYMRLSKSHPTPFSCFMNFGKYQVISASPERFLSLHNTKLQTRPIKGTLKRMAQNNDNSVNELIASSKEKAELSMICDLMRNDLGRISRPGTVKCIHQRKLLSLSTLYHMESVIEGEALNKHPLDLIRLCFPPGSVTGCPKVRAMQIIADFEQRPRHLYCGAIGYFSYSGDFDFNVAIRTAVYQKGILEYQVGGGLTSDSNPEEEYQETLSKAISLKTILCPIQKLSKKNTKKAPIRT